MAMPRGKRAGIRLRLNSNGRTGLWTIQVMASGRGEYLATFRQCKCTKHVCTLRHRAPAADHLQQFCHQDGGWHLPHIEVFVGDLLRSYGVTARRRVHLVREREVISDAA